MNSDELNTLPEGWELVKFDDLFNITSSKRVHKKDWVSKGVPFYRAREIVKLSSNGFVDNELFITNKMFDEFNEKYGSPEEDDILVTGVGTLGICYIVKPNDKFYFKDGNIIWFKKKVKVESRYIEYGFRSDYIRNQVYSGGGSTVATYTIIRAKNTTIPLPPLKEQKRIVDKIDTLFAKIDKAISLTEESLKQAKNLLPSIIDETFDSFDAEKVDLKSVSDAIQYGYTGKTIENGKYYYLRITDIQGGMVNYQSTPYSDIDGIDIEKYRLNKGDILFARTGATAGKSYLFNDDVEAVFASYLIRVVCNQDIVKPSFVKWFFLSANYWKQIFGNIVGAAQPNFNGKKLGELNLKIPSIEQQELVIGYLEKVSKQTKQTQSKLEEQLVYLKQLKSSILSKAFKGEL